MTAERESLFADRPEVVDSRAITEAAERFVAALGWRNAAYLRDNLKLTTEKSDALRALNCALIADFNVVRQEQIRREQQTRTRCSRCERELHGYRGPLCRYCDGTAE